jgi:hypothetical protein
LSVPKARAFVLDEASARGPREALQGGHEFAHIRPPEDGSLHMTLPDEVADAAYAAGWGEAHPLTGTPLILGPRDEAELLDDLDSAALAAPAERVSQRRLLPPPER